MVEVLTKSASVKTLAFPNKLFADFMYSKFPPFLREKSPSLCAPTGQKVTDPTPMHEGSVYFCCQYFPSCREGFVTNKETFFYSILGKKEKDVSLDLFKRGSVIQKKGDGLYYQGIVDWTRAWVKPLPRMSLMIPNEGA